MAKTPGYPRPKPPIYQQFDLSDREADFANMLCNDLLRLMHKHLDNAWLYNAGTKAAAAGLARAMECFMEGRPTLEPIAQTAEAEAEAKPKRQRRQHAKARAEGTRGKT